MLLEDKVAVIYGAGGAIGGAVARAFAPRGRQAVPHGPQAGPVDEVARTSSPAGADGGRGRRARRARVDAPPAAVIERRAASTSRSTRSASPTRGSSARR